MRLSWILFITCFWSYSAFSQQDTLKYWVQFTDKNNTIYSIHNPLEFLSQRALDRRMKNQISVTEQDFPVNSWYVDSLTQHESVQLINTSRWFNAVTISCWDTNAINAINLLPFVNQTIVVQRLAVQGADVDFEEILDNTNRSQIQINVTHLYPYGFTYNQNHLHKIDYLHEMGFRGEGLHIAVIDAGFEFVHGMACFNHLFEEGRILSTKDFVDHDGDVFWDHLHGTVVLSTMAAIVPGQFYGTAPNASYHLLRSEAAEYEHIVEEDNWVAAAEYADSAGVDIINTSLGYTTFDDETQNHTYADLNGNTTRIAIASNIAASKGILLVTSAGNNGGGPWQYISTPADATDALTVGAVDSLGNYAPFSSVGPNSAGAIKPNVASVGWFTYVVSPWGEEIVKANGTSFSSPMMAGMAACLWQALPHYSNFELKALIESSSHQFQQPDSLLGYGIPDFHKAYQTATGFSYPLQEGIELLNHYPNPTTNELNLIVRSDRNQKIVLKFTTLSGQVVESIEVEIQFGVNKIELSDFFCGQGLVIINITDETSKEVILKIVRAE
jgi:hypothetical protein